ncbi:MAG: AMP-binding protein [Bacteroidales bacterium]|nr:AMP-binding protein [Bacteroidales bacterium]MBN2819799.1 AMP-binding protein [Bacteroidales bacterium]
MVNFDFPGIILHDRLFSKEDLLTHAKQKVQEDIPGFEKKIYLFILEFLDDKDYILQNSSGTTGKQKEIKLPKRALIESAKLTTQVLGLKFGDKALLCLSVDYIAGKMMIIRSFVSGLNLFWEEPSSMPVLSRYGKIQFCAMVPLQVFNSFSNYEFFRNIDILLIGGSEMRSEIKATFRDVQNRTYETYGMSETASHIALRKISGQNPDKYFKVLPGIKIEKDARGCLVVHVPFLDEPVHTNDLVDIIDESQFLWLGRYDNIINSGGIKVKPEEIEASIAKVIDADFAIIGLPDEKLGQAIAIVIESDQQVNEAEIKELLKEILPSNLMPRRFLNIETLPRTSSYKVDRNSLQGLFAE